MNPANGAEKIRKSTDVERMGVLPVFAPETGSKRSLILALLISLVLHLLLLMIYRPLSTWSLLIPAETQPTAEQNLDEPIVFELVETPNDAATDQPPQESRFVSDKNALARDRVQREDLSPDMPFSQGQSDFRIFSGGGSPETSQSAADASNDDNRPPERIEDAISASERPAPQQTVKPFHVSMLRNRSTDNARPSRDYSDDADWNQQRFSAEALGDVTLNTYAWDFAPYLLAMKRKIRRNVYPPPAFTQLAMISGETVLRFRVYPDGAMQGLEVLSFKGHPALMETSVNAVKASHPFNKLPDSFPESFLELTWTFVYSIVP
ncbi:hypothetical protein JW992_06260 [candidate division KSB1 bacterium]|nr:hypothetical protein [candidate division KSB1 bacterium]